MARAQLRVMELERQQATERARARAPLQWSSLLVLLQAPPLSCSNSVQAPLRARATGPAWSSLWLGLDLLQCSRLWSRRRALVPVPSLTLPGPVRGEPDRSVHRPDVFTRHVMYVCMHCRANRHASLMTAFSS